MREIFYVCRMNPKQIAGERAVDYLETGMTVGLGTGSTAYWAIREIGSRIKQGLRIRAVPTSCQSEIFARELDIPIAPFSEVEKIDLDIDGADEVDHQLNLIKGGGGALLREKIIAAASHTFIIVADESKWVETLGNFPLPVEVFPFAWELTFRQLKQLGCIPVMRQEKSENFVSDNGNFIIDCAFGSMPDPSKVLKQLGNIPGIAGHGLFLGMADIVIIGKNDGSYEILESKK
jgi:ribose 5-phosphate isomerase A